MSDTIQILLAEDNPADVYLIEEALREHGLKFEILLARDGEQASALLQDESVKPDLVLLDLNMPKRGGGEVLSLLHGSSVPIVILTSSESPADKMQALRLGASHFICKPSSLDEFLGIGAIIKQILGR